MRLSDWEATDRGRKVMTDKVADAYRPAMAVLGTEPDPVAHIVWGDDPDVRYVILAIGEAGLVVVNVRVNVPQEGPRASAKLVRWSRVQAGELSVEAHHGHRHVTSQVENHVLQGSDDDADGIGGFMAHVLARIDGRVVELDGRSKPNRRSTSTTGPIQLPAATDRT